MHDFHTRKKLVFARNSYVLSGIFLIAPHIGVRQFLSPFLDFGERALLSQVKEVVSPGIFSTGRISRYPLLVVRFDFQFIPALVVDVLGFAVPNTLRVVGAFDLLIWTV